MGQKRDSLLVPIIHHDLRQEETTVQIAIAFDYLNVAVNSIFNHINSSINCNKVRLAKLQQRSNIVKSKVEKLSGTNRATKVFSCGKYPASDTQKDYEFEFNFPETRLSLDKSEIRINSPIVTHPLQDKAKFFHVKRDSNAAMMLTMRKNIELMSGEGLGSLPEDLDYISSLLLFNTSENLYKDYVLLDPLYAFNNTRSTVDVDEKNELEAAPKTMSLSEKTVYKDPQYFYSPTLKHLPEINVPLDLPDLPGVAGDLRYNLETDLAISPSVASTQQIDSYGIAAPVLKNEVTTTVALPPVLPQISELPATEKTVPELVLPTPAPPPPPPPMPPITETPVTVPETAPVSNTTKDTQPTGTQMKPQLASDNMSDCVANLMEAIRKAGGSEKAKLRSVSNTKDARNITKEDKNVNQGGNFMDDLYNKLRMRRKGISGNKTEDASESAIERMLKNPILPAKGSETEDEEDWEVDYS